MEGSLGGGSAGTLPLQGQAARREWRKVSEMPNGQGRLGGDGPGNPPRTHHSGRPRSGSMGQRRSSQNGRMFHPGSSEHSSDSDHHGPDASAGHLIGSGISSQDMINQNIGQQDALYDEMHRQQQNERAAMNTMSMESGRDVMNSPEDALEQQLLDVSRKREQLQQAELELRAQFIARSEVHRMQNSYEEQSKQHGELVASLQNEIHERDQRIHHLEQSLEEREQQHRANQMQANEAVWAKDGLLQQQTNELASLRRDRDSALEQQKVALSQLDAERSDYAAQIDHLKEQLHEKERQRHEAEEQNRTSQDLLLYKDGQLQDAQAWMARAQELDAYHINANNTLHAELRDRNDQLNQVWMGYQRQLADMERFHAQVVQRLHIELNEAREHSKMLKGVGTGAKEERQVPTGHQMDVKREANGETGVKAPPTSNSGMGEQATGLPVVPSPAVVGMSPGISSVGTPVMQQYSFQQQPLAAVSQTSSVPHASFPQVHMHPHVLSTPHLPSAQQQIGHAQLHQNSQQQPTQVPHHGVSSASLPKQSVQPSLPHQHVLDREESQQHGGILLSQLSSKVQAPASSTEPSVQQEVTVTEPLQPSREGQKSPLVCQDQQQVEHHRQSNAQPESQRQEQQQHSQGHKPVHDEAHQMQHQQGISSSMHHLSQPPAPAAEENQLQHKPSPSKSVIAKQEPRHAAPNPQHTMVESSKTPEPVLLDEEALLTCLVRAIPAEASAKISIKSTLPNRLGKMLAPLHWQSYRKQYGRLDEFVSSHKELFVIEGDYIYLREGAHAKVAATTAAAKASAAAAAANPVGLDRLPAVAVTPVAQLQRGRNAKAANKDSRPQSQQDEANVHTQRSVSPQLSKAGNLRQNSASFVPRNSVGDGVSGPAKGGKSDVGNNTSGAELSKKSSIGNISDNGDANGYESSRGAGHQGSRQPSSRNSNAGSGQVKKQENHFRAQAQDGRPRPTPAQ